MTDFSFYLCPKCGYDSKIIGDDLVEKYHRKVIREFLEKNWIKFMDELEETPCRECKFETFLRTIKKELEESEKK